MNENVKTWTEGRPIAVSLPSWLAGLLNLAIILVFSTLVWYVFFSPSGPISLYTPNVGVSLVITILMVIHWGVDVFDFWPFKKEAIMHAHPAAKGTVLTLAYVVIGLLVMYGLYNNVVGRFGAIFFSGTALLKSGGLGQYAQTAAENASYAQIMMNTCIIFFTILWLTAFEYKPWENSRKMAAGFAVWAVGMLAAVIAFSFLFYPHIAYQFYPAQTFMAVEPWWQEWAMTLSSMFHFGWLVPALVMLYWTNMLWEGRPWSLIRQPFLKGVVMTATIVPLAIIIMLVSNRIMDWYWDTEAFIGGSTLENPPWRWNHVAEMAMFMQVAAFALVHYFDNQLKGMNLTGRAVTRTIIAIAGGLVLAKLYYLLAPVFLGAVQGIAQEGDTSLCWTVMLLILMYVHAIFFGGWPLKKQGISAMEGIRNKS